MYNLTVSNKFAFPVMVHTEAVVTVAPGGTFTIPHALGNAYVDVSGVGHVLFLDVADKAIGGFSKATWGVYVAYQGEEAVFRYEGGGQITLTISELGQADLAGNGGFSRIALGSIIIPV
jgi:hypothetical protein